MLGTLPVSTLLVSILLSLYRFTLPLIIDNHNLMIDTDNPLIIPILDILKQSGTAMSEHELIVQLRQLLDTLPGRSASSQLALFQTHFMVMNALYQLQQSLVDENIYLYISPLKIYLQAASDTLSTAVADNTVDESLRHYYLDWDNMEQTSEQDVQSLLDGFWQYYLAEDKQADAYKTLGVEVGADWGIVKKAYRRLIVDAHPDRGGDAAEFMAVREAYEVLLKAAS